LVPQVIACSGGGMSSDLDQNVLFQCENLRLQFGANADRVVALESLTFGLRRGEFAAIVGPSGCGKSTFLRIIAGLLQPSAGQLCPVDEKKRQTGLVSLMFQSPVLLPWRTVLGNVVLAADLAGTPRDPEAVRERALSLLRLVGLTDFVDRYPFELSGGMQQRVALARALLLDPELMLLDEPFSALDALTREEMNFELQRLWLQSGATVLFVTHDIAEAITLSDRVLVMSARPGRIIAEVKVPLPRPRSASIRYDHEFMAAHKEIYSALHAGGPTANTRPQNRAEPELVEAVER
jgi:NitT/TauT family transport system ATP-binding protein